MPANRLRSSLLKPLVVLAIPGMYLVYKYNQFKRQQQENSRRKVTEKELEHLNHKIDKLLAKLDEHEGGDDPKISEEEECVVCLCAKATMQTFPCGHRVVCRKCFVKTIQVAVSQRCLPLRCVVCRTRILKLRQTAEEPLTPQLPRKQYPGAGGFYTPTIGPKVPKHSSSLRQFFSSSGSSKQRSSSPAVAGRRGHGLNGGPSTARLQASAAPVATKLMQPLLIYPSQTSPKQHRAFGSDFHRLAMQQAAATSSSSAHSDPASSSHATSRHHTLNLTHHQQSTASPPPPPPSSSSSSSSSSPSAAAAAAAPASPGRDAFMAMHLRGSSEESRQSHEARSHDQSLGGRRYSQFVQSPRLARCSHCSPHIHPSPRPASVSRVSRVTVKQNV